MPANEEARPAGRLIVGFDRQPPREIRTGATLPQFVVSFKIEGSDDDELEREVAEGKLNAVAALMTAGGQREVGLDPPELVMRPMAATPQRRQSNGADDMDWDLAFGPNRINIEGYFRIQVSLMLTPLSGDVGIGSPVLLLDINSCLIHVHDKAPWIPNVSLLQSALRKMLGLLSY